MPRAAPGGLCSRCLIAGALDQHSSIETMNEGLENPSSMPTVRVAHSICTADPLEGTKIGRYKLLQHIGEGGFGMVYMAEQVEHVHRKVAIKIIKAGMDTKQVIARFEAERQALAMMDHPNITRVFDVGETEEGRPYFVMELVKGVPITTYCHDEKLSINERLDLFMQVCRAVQHAHVKGIIHRDLKPSNILITLHDGAPVPKVIDFGIAKAMDQRLTDKTLFTRYEHIIGTPAYMSPEQAALSGLDVDTRSDVYALGVLLYELLTGTTPFDAETLRKAAFDEMRRMIREEEPQKPSTRLTSQKTDRATARGTLSMPSNARISQDLDWIAMKALEKDRGRRYGTASSLAEDIERSLRDEPVTAGPPDLRYKVRKFVDRNRTAVGAAALVFFTLVSGIILATWGMLRAQSAEEDSRKNAELARESETKAQEEADIARAINEFLTEDLLAQAGPNESPDRDVKLRVVVDRAEAHLNERFRTQPLIEAEVRMTLAQVYAQVGEGEKARENAKRAAELWTRELGEDNPKTLRAKALFSGIGTRDNGDLDTLNAVVRTQREVLGRYHADTLESAHRLVSKCVAMGFGRRAFDVLKVVGEFPDPASLETAARRHLLALMLLRSKIDEYGDWNDRIAEARKATAFLEADVGKLHPSTLHGYATLAEHMMHRSGSPDVRRESAREGADIYRQLVPRMSQVLGSTHSATIKNQRAYSIAKRVALSDPAGSLETERELYAVLLDEFGALDPKTIIQIQRLVSATYYLHNDEVGSGEGNTEKLLGEFRSQAGNVKSALFSAKPDKTSGRVTRSLIHLGDVYTRGLAPFMRLGRKNDAEFLAEGLACYERAIAIEKAAVRADLPADEWSHGEACQRAGSQHLYSASQGRDYFKSIDKAESNFIQSLEILKDDPEERHGLILDRSHLLQVYALSGRSDKYARFLEDLIGERLRDLDRASLADRSIEMRSLLNVYTNLGRFSQAIDLWMQAAAKDPILGHGYARRGAMCALMAGERQLYEEICSRSLKRYDDPEALNALPEQIALVALLDSRNSDRIRKAIALIGRTELTERAQQRLGDYDQYAIPYYAPLLAAYRSEDYATAEQLIRNWEGESLTSQAIMRSVQALIYHRTGKPEEAQSELENAWYAVERLYSGTFNGASGWWFFSLVPATAIALEAAREIEATEEARLRPVSYFWDARIESVTMPHDSEIIVGPGAEWKFLHPSDGVDPATVDANFHATFFLSSYNDEAWEKGREGTEGGEAKGFGYGRSVAVEWITPALGNRKSAYLRHHFTTEKSYRRLWLRMQCDDGAIIYLDGAEAGRLSVGRDLTESYGLQANAIGGGSGEAEFNWRPVVLKGGIDPGAHTLAISLHNRSADSSDLRIGAITLLGLP